MLGKPHILSFFPGTSFINSIKKSTRVRFSILNTAFFQDTAY